jgi:hypothetical protein
LRHDRSLELPLANTIPHRVTTDGPKRTVDLHLRARSASG